MTISKSEKRQMCIGCDDNFYNGNNELGVKECWSLKTAKRVKKFWIGWWTPMDRKENFISCTTLSCYHETGKRAYLDKLPDHILRKEAAKL